jgi:hypothetical protein
MLRKTRSLSTNNAASAGMACWTVATNFFRPADSLLGLSYTEVPYEQLSRVVD